MEGNLPGSWVLGGARPLAEPPPRAPFRETRTLGVSGRLMREAPARLFAARFLATFLRRACETDWCPAFGNRYRAERAVFQTLTQWLATECGQS